MSNPLLRWPAVALGMLSSSIGWGIRGNYGHEYGAMMPGSLCAICVALCSGREDWRARVPFFAFFGAIGWAFGGSMSYMTTMSYAESGHLASQLYGFLAVFAIGFLWASLGGAGTAFAAVADRDRLTELYKPLCWVLSGWALQSIFESWYSARFEAARQLDPLYWLDSDWLAAVVALAAVALFDLWDRRFRKAHLLAVFGLAGAATGWAAQQLLGVLGWLGPLQAALVHYQGDTALFPPDNLLTNWPQFMFDLSPQLGWMAGLAAGCVVYFRVYGAFRSGSGLLARMAGYGLLAFLAGPVLLSNLFQFEGGFRMVPPRGDNWAIVAGALIGLIDYARRNNLRPVAYAALGSGLIGGIGFMAAEMAKILALTPGNPVLTQDQGAITAWAHWRSANWHSILAEQGAGLLYGVAIVLPMAALAAHIPVRDGETRSRRWTEYFSIAFVLNLILYVNLVKNVDDWTRARGGGFRPVAERLKAPLLASWEMTAENWFNLAFLLITLCTVALLIAHARRPLALIPPTWLGRGQMLYLALLWAIVTGNFMRAVVSFHEQRLATEGAVFLNAIVATFLVLYSVRAESYVPDGRPAELQRIFRRGVAAGLVALFAGTLAFTGITRSIYGDQAVGWGGYHLRFGEQADWRARPLLKDKAHR